MYHTPLNMPISLKRAKTGRYPPFQKPSFKYFYLCFPPNLKVSTPGLIVSLESQRHPTESKMVIIGQCHSPNLAPAGARFNR